MTYTDNPLRPLTHFWFGPLTMVDFLGNYNLWTWPIRAGSMFCWWPGTCHESPMYECKLGIQALKRHLEQPSQRSGLRRPCSAYLARWRTMAAIQPGTGRIEQQLLQYAGIAVVSCVNRWQQLGHGDAV